MTATTKHKKTDSQKPQSNADWIGMCHTTPLDHNPQQLQLKNPNE
jgi:hypothetical protein